MITQDKFLPLHVEISTKFSGDITDTLEEFGILISILRMNALEKFMKFKNDNFTALRVVLYSFSWTGCAFRAVIRVVDSKDKEYVFGDGDSCRQFALRFKHDILMETGDFSDKKHF